MASSALPILLLLLVSLVHLSTTSAARQLPGTSQTSVLRYHDGPLLTRNMSINFVWYGDFKPAQRTIITDFIASLSPSTSGHKIARPSVGAWWNTIQRYYINPKSSKKPSSLALSLGSQIIDRSYSLGKTLSRQNIERLAGKGGRSNAISVVLTSSDVAVEGFCSSSCGRHGSFSRSTAAMKGHKRTASRLAYVWVGNSETQCPGQCAWPFHQPIYGPQSPPLVAPNNDVGLDGMVINLAGLLAGTVTNPFGNGYYQGSPEAPLEAASACTGVYGSGAYPGYAGNLLVDSTTGGSYNANGVNGRKYLLPALMEPSTAKCSTLV